MFHGLPGFLTENLGPVDNPEVRFYAQGDSLSVGLPRDGLIITLLLLASNGASPPDGKGDVREVTGAPAGGTVPAAWWGAGTDSCIGPMWDQNGLTFMDGTGTSATTGDPFAFNLTVEGGDGVRNVRVVHWFGNRTAEARNESMTAVDIDAGGNGTYGHDGLVVPSDSLAPIGYSFAAMAPNGTWASTPPRSIEVIDNDLPMFGQDLSDAEMLTGRNVRLATEVQDNIGVDEVWVMYNTTQPPVFPYPTMVEESPGVWSYDDIALPIDSLATFHYKFIAIDTSGGVQHSAEKSKVPIDVVAPSIVADRTGECVKGIATNITVEAEDNIAVASAHVTYWLGGTMVGDNLTMVSRGLGIFSIGVEVPRHPTGQLTYIVNVTDGRSWATGPMWNRTPVNKPPEVQGLLEWRVTEGIYDAFDLSTRIVDPNDPLSAITVTCSAPNIDVDGLVLHARYDVPIPDHLFDINVSDGEDVTRAQVWVHILKMNDPPVFTSIPPTGGQVNVTYSYQVAYTDEEREDTHTFSLAARPDGMTVDANGLVTWRPTRTQHDYQEVSLTISDSEAMVHQRWTIFVTPEPKPKNQAPVFKGSPPRAAQVGTEYSWDAEATDADTEDTLYFHLLTGPANCSFDNRTGMLRWTPSFPGNNVSVDVPFELEVTDGYDHVRLPFVVRVRSLQDAPPSIIGTMDDVTITGPWRTGLSEHMSDPDDSVANLTWRIEVSDPELLSATVELGKLVLRPMVGRQGKAEIVLYLEDPSGLYDTVTFDVRVVEDGPAIPAWLLVVLAVVLLFILAGGLSMRRSARREAALRAAERGEVIAEVEEAPAARAKGSAKPSYIVEEVLVVYRDGRLIVDCAREECRTKDADLMSGMLITIQGIIQDGLERGGELESIKYGDNTIVMACGDHINVATVIYGEPDGELRDRVERMLARVEGSFAGVIEEWTGDLAVFKGIDGMVAPILKPTAGLTRADIQKTGAYVDVTLLSAVDFHRGYVRLKVATLNATKDVILDAAVEVRYDPDMLRLERIDPSTIKLRGDRATLGNVKPGEKKTVAFLFDPQICQETHIDGTLTYYDTKGELQRLEMKRRQADVVCPIFFTKEHANTAMLRRLIKEKLDQSDVRLFTYTKDLSPEVALVLGKSVAGGDNVQLVREFVVEGPPFEAEVWYYGETKAKGYQMVMRLSVLDEKKAIEFFAASTAMEPVTGLLAEFRRDLEQMLEEKYAGTVKVQTVRDEVLKRELELRQLFLFTFGEREDQGQAG